jgi:hypothetical protein
MAKIDPEQERRRLTESYSGQLDGELEKVATQAYELTELAREALRAELTRRGLSADLIETTPVIAKVIARKELTAQPGDPPPETPRPTEPREPDGELELRPLVTIRKFRDLPEALLAKGSLESAEIESALIDDNLVRLDWFWSNLMGGIKLQVDPENVEAAQMILDQPIPEILEVPGIGA